MFFVANLVFFLVESALHWNVMTTRFATQIERMPYSSIARALAEWVAARRGVRIEDLAEDFNATSATLAKTLVIAMAPLFALFVALAGRGRGAVAHLVFALHFLAVFLLLESALLLATKPVQLVLEARGIAIESQALDTTLTLILGAVLSIYLRIAVRRVFGFTRWRAIAWTIALFVGFVTSLYGYRALLFVLALLHGS